MNYVLDTNSIIYAINSSFILPEKNYLISVITEMELLSYSKLTQNDILVLKEILSKFRIIDLNISVKDEAIRLRREMKLKLPDSIILATAIVNKAILITSDKQLMQHNLIKTIELWELKK